MTSPTIFDELKHKTKTVSDLIRFVGNRTEETPVFSLFLGSGCSISSGVKSGGTLINDWKDEIGKELTDLSTSEGLDDYLEKQLWYDSRNAYASLFEHRYDLQSQRRSFLEKLIRDAKPSIGYAYLTKLVERNFFNTIFTTNFDDLINEAFYLYSDKRPIVCAHDSAISSIAVTSSRPKIIKLHGDYLFENLKNTLRETESLEDNMKDKFMEFAKDFGLVVVGYSGCDRSIMDILSVMIKNPDYFKNGIYWCIHKSTTDVSSELKKLLWNDRVYIVSFDGFDELMAQMNYVLNKDQLPINSDVLSKKHQLNMIDSLVSNEIVKSSDSPIIKRDISKLKAELNKNTVRDFLDLAYTGLSTKKELRNRAERKGPFQYLTDDEHKETNRVVLLIEKGDYDEALSFISNAIHSDISITLKSAYLYLQLAVLQKKGVCENSKYLPILTQLIELNPDNEAFYIDASNRSEKMEDKIRFIDDALRHFPNDAFLYESKANVMRHFYCDLAVRDDEREKEIIKAYKRSIELQHNISNQAWVSLCEFYDHYYSNNIEKKKQEVEEILRPFENEDRYHPSVLKAYQVITDTSKIEWGNRLKDSYEWSQKADMPDRCEECLMLYTDYLFNNGKAYEAWEFIKKYEDLYVASAKMIRHKAFWKTQVEQGDIDGAIELYKRVFSENASVRFELMRLYAIREKWDEIDKIRKQFTDEATLLEYYSVTDKGNDYCDYIEEHYITNKTPISEEILITYTYYAITTGRYEKGYKLAKEYIQIPSCQKALWINYLILDCKFTGRDVEKKKVEEKILSKKESFGNDVIAAAYGLIGDVNNAVNHICKYLKNHNISKYTMRNWPAFEKIKTIEKFKKAVGISDTLIYQ